MAIVSKTSNGVQPGLLGIDGTPLYIPNGKELPDYIAKQLATSPAVGSRHDAMCRLSIQMTGEKVPDAEQFGLLRVWCPNQPGARPIPDDKIRELIRGSHKLNPQPTTIGAGYSKPLPKPAVLSAPAVDPESLPELPRDLRETTPIEFLERLFRPDDFICVTWANGDGQLNQNEIHQLIDWREIYNEHPERFADTWGVWYTINPLTDDKQRGNEYVAEYRYCLLEGDARTDTPEHTLEDKRRQYAWIKTCGLPIAAIYDSAGKLSN
jgi:hypothetical protein